MRRKRIPQRKPIILAIVGEKSSGKGTATAYLQRKPGVAVFRFSKVLDDILVRLNLDEHSRENQGRLAEILRNTFGGDVLARSLMTDVRKKRLSIAVLDGVRKPEELRFLRAQPKFMLLFLKAPVTTRWQRAKRRAHRHDDFFSLKKFAAYERTAAFDKYIPSLAKQADIMIENTGTKRDLFRELEAMVGQIKSKL